MDHQSLGPADDKLVHTGNGMRPVKKKPLSNQMQSTCKIQEYINPYSKNQISIIKWWFLKVSIPDFGTVVLKKL